MALYAAETVLLLFLCVLRFVAGAASELLAVVVAVVVVVVLLLLLREERARVCDSAKVDTTGVEVLDERPFVTPIVESAGDICTAALTVSNGFSSGRSSLSRDRVVFVSRASFLMVSPEANWGVFSFADSSVEILALESSGLSTVAELELLPRGTPPDRGNVLLPLFARLEAEGGRWRDVV